MLRVCVHLRSSVASARLADRVDEFALMLVPSETVIFCFGDDGGRLRGAGNRRRPCSVVVQALGNQLPRTARAYHAYANADPRARRVEIPRPAVAIYCGPSVALGFRVEAPFHVTQIGVAEIESIRQRV